MGFLHFANGIYYSGWEIGHTPFRILTSNTGYISHYIIQNKVLFSFLHIRLPTSYVCKHFLYVRRACTARLTKLTEMGAKGYKIVYGHTFVNALPGGSAPHLRSKVQHKFQSFLSRLNLHESPHLNYDLTGTICTHRRQQNREKVFPQPRG